MTTLPQVATAMQTVLTTKADAAGRQSGFVQRPTRAKLTGSVFTQTLVLGLLANPDASLEALTETAARIGVDISAQALDQRFSPAGASCLKQVFADTVHEVIASDPVAIPILQRFTGVVVQDSTTIPLPDALADTWPGCGGDGPQAALKCGVQLDLLTGALPQVELVAGRVPDQASCLQTAPLAAGSLRLADLGFFDLDVLAQLSAQGVYWLSKLRSTTVLSFQQQRFSLLEFVQTHLAEGGEAWVGVGKQQVQARLLVMPVPQEVADQRRRRLRKEAKDKGRMVSAVALALAGWTLLITNVPQALLSIREAVVVARARWQIELLFKLWKSHGLLEQSRSSKPWRMMCEVYAKLIGLVIQQWLLVVSCWRYADRSLVKASQTVRSHAHELASRLGEVVPNSQVLWFRYSAVCSVEGV